MMRHPIFLLLGLFLLTGTAWALDPAKQADFDAVLRMNMPTLTAEASAILDKNYPDEDWERYQFPNYVFTSESVEVGYKIAVKRPELLKKVTCYCFCEAMGHESLLHCFISKDDPTQFDDHASDCNICYGQAMMALIWDSQGASDAEITAGMEKRFKRLIENRENR